jgi:hypothetical protein
VSRFRMLVWVLAALVANACATNAPPPSPAVTIPTTAPVTALTTQSTPPTLTTRLAPPTLTMITTAPTMTVTTSTPVESLDVAWVPPGPIGTVQPTCLPTPTNESATPRPAPNCPTTTNLATPEWTQAFTSRDCAAIGALGSGDTEPIYQGLSHACVALTDNSPARWQAAREALTRVGSSPSCPDRLALGLLTDLVKAHNSKPDARIRIVDPTVSPEAACR